MKRVSQEENYEFDYKGITDRLILEYSKYQKRPFTRSETIHNLNQGSASKREKDFEKHSQPKMKRGISVQNLTEKLSPRKEVRTGYAQKRNQNTQNSWYFAEYTNLQQQSNTWTNKAQPQAFGETNFPRFAFEEVSQSQWNLQKQKIKEPNLDDKKFDQAARKGLISRAASRKGFVYFYNASYK
jgi:hypothetical protein